VITDKTKLWKDPLIVVMMVMYFVCTSSIIATNYYIFDSFMPKKDDTHGQIFAVRLLQLTVGLAVGMTTMFMGAVSIWIGLKEGFEAGGELATSKGKIVAAGPGTLLIICGTVIVCICINKDMAYRTTEPVPVQDNKPLKMDT
jgi:hypothetical protein